MPKIYARHRKGFLVELDDVNCDKIDIAIDWLIAHDYQPDPPTGIPGSARPMATPFVGGTMW